MATKNVKNLKKRELSKEDFDLILSLPGRTDFDQEVQASVVILMDEGLMFSAALKKAKGDLTRENFSTGAVKFDDDLVEVLNEDSFDVSFLASRDASLSSNSDDFEVDAQTKKVLKRFESGADFGRKLGLTPRRGQQKIKKTVEKIESERKFGEGEKGQGSLFPWAENIEKNVLVTV